MSKTAHILAIEVATLPPLGYNSGRPDCVNDARVWIGPRQHLEYMDPSNKIDGQIILLQVIPYLVLEYKNEVLAYVRPAKGGDERLSSKVSIGIGGHIDFIDAVPNDQGEIDFDKTLYGAAMREASEEVGLKLDPKRLRWTGTIYANDSEVDRVHLGAVGFYELNDNEFAALEANHEIGEHKFVAIGDIATTFGETAQIETWTKLVASPAS
jgi:predicted NUDIX family phosphoesterase